MKGWREELVAKQEKNSLCKAADLREYKGRITALAHPGDDWGKGLVVVEALTRRLVQR